MCSLNFGLLQLFGPPAVAYWCSTYPGGFPVLHSSHCIEWPVYTSGSLIRSWAPESWNHFCLVCHCILRMLCHQYWHLIVKLSVQFSSVAQLCLTLCDPMNHSTPGLPVHHQIPEFTETHFHQVGDAIQPSHPLSSLLLLPQSLPASEAFQWVNSAWDVQSTGVSASESFLPKKSQGWSPSEWIGWISLV